MKHLECLKPKLRGVWNKDASGEFKKKNPSPVYLKLKGKKILIQYQIQQAQLLRYISMIYTYKNVFHS